MNLSRKLTRRSTLGVILVVLLGGLSLANWAERGRFGVPEDGVAWVDSEGGVTASRVETNSPAARVGVRPGDMLVSIAGQPVAEALDATRILSGVGSWKRTEYVVGRSGRTEHISVVVGESETRGTVGGFLLILGWAYALMGILVWLRCPPDPAATRFFGFCLASLAVYSLSSTGQLDGFDRLVHWVDVWALLLAPALLLDFCDRFPDGVARHPRRSRVAYSLAIAVGAAHHAAAGNWVGAGIPETELLDVFESVPLVLLAANLAFAAIAVWTRNWSSREPLHRVQTRVLVAGIVAAIVPFGVLYVVPFALGRVPGPSQTLSVFSLAALPAAMAVALFRYRLLEFEVAWRRATASVLAGGGLLAAGYAALLVGGTPSLAPDGYGPAVWVCSLLVATALFRPVRDAILRFLERQTYRERYEDRRALAGFAGELAVASDAGRIVRAVASRLTAALQVDRVIVLARPEAGEGKDSVFSVVGDGGRGAGAPHRNLDLSAVADRVPEFGTASVVAGRLEEDLPPQLAALGCRQFVPCRLRGRTLAWIALGSPKTGGLLTSDDLSLVEAVATSVAIALENARLYASLHSKALQYQRLKDYNENIVESLSVGIMALDARDRVQSWNTQLELAFHISREQATGRTLRELLPDSLVGEIERCQDENGSGEVHKLAVRAADFPAEFRAGGADTRSERRFNVAVAPLIAKDFRKVGRLVILDDVTERLELEDRVAQADKLSSVGLLAAGVAHEVNTPLAVISTYAQSLAARHSPESAEGRMLSKVTEQTFRASEIVNSLLDFSRTGGTRMTQCDLDRTVRDTLDLIGPQLRLADVAVETDLRANSSVFANRGKLQQVFLNLFLNARDAMPDGGTLTVASREVADGDDVGHVEVLVSDSGTGIDLANQGRIFDPFFSTKEAGRGTGLGLAVTYGIVQEHSGSISVESAPGKGTRFRLAFPLARRPMHV